MEYTWEVGVAMYPHPSPQGWLIFAKRVVCFFLFFFFFKEADKIFTLWAKNINPSDFILQIKSGDKQLRFGFPRSPSLGLGGGGEVQMKY